jgi:hypothetical protein
MELFGTHWPPGTANKTRMMIRERWIPSLQQKMPPLNLQHHCNVHLLCCHSNTKIVAPIDCASESITDGPRYCHPSLHLSPLLHHAVHIHHHVLYLSTYAHKICPTTHHIILQHTLQHTCKTIGPLTDTSYACTATELQTHSHHPPDAR